MACLAMFNDANTVLMKHAASCSEFGNALDAGNIHKATKKRQRHMTDSVALFTKDSVVTAIIEERVFHQQRSCILN